MSKILKMLGVFLLAMGLCGCQSKFLSELVVKTYNLTTQLEKYVFASDPIDLAMKISELEAPLRTCAKATEYISRKIYDANVKAILAEISEKAYELADTIKEGQQTSPENIEKLRARLLVTITKIKTALEKIAERFKIELKVAGLLDENTIYEIITKATELEVIMRFE